MSETPDLDARDAEFAELFRRFLSEVVHRAASTPSRRTPLGDRISDHLVRMPAPSPSSKRPSRPPASPTSTPASRP